MSKLKKYIAVIKAIWANKRYRALFFIILYFIFHFTIIATYRININRRINYEKLNTSDSIFKYDEEYNREIILSLDDKKIIINNLKDNDNNTYTVVSDELFNHEPGVNLSKNDFLDTNYKYLFELSNNNLYNYLDESSLISNTTYTNGLKKDSYNLSLSKVVSIEKECSILVDTYLDDDKITKIEADLSDCHEYIDSNVEKIEISIEYKEL